MAGGPAGLGGPLEEGRVRLEPLEEGHLEGLVEAAAWPRIWAWMPVDLRSRAALEAWLGEALAAREAGTEVPFAVVVEGRVGGSTRYLDVRRSPRAVEIGWTWYSPPHWGTDVNPRSKLLLLRRAFEEWGAVRVQLKTDGENLRSQAAIRKLGALPEGVLRNHRVRADGTVADSAMFSITDSEWPRVAAGLAARLGE
ncbi:MAG: GNAT family N-acetyltransferase [Candidatus Dormibacterales bacterium]